MKVFAQATDTQLINHFKSGENAALEVLIERHKEKIFTTILFLIKDRHLAEDFFQEVFIKIIDTIRGNRYNDEGKFLPWALRVSHNLCIDYLRKTNRTVNVASDERNIFETIGSIGDAADSKIVKLQTNTKLQYMINALPDEQREVIVLRHFAGMSFKEIADATNSSINTSLGRMRYALINLRKFVEEKQIVL